MYVFIHKHALTLCITWVFFIFILCATPGQYIPSTTWLELLSFDKFVHASMFFILTALTFYVLVKYRRATWYIRIVLLLCILYGVLLELMQATWFTNRSADWKDMVANTFGCIMALAFLSQIRKMHQKVVG